MAALPRVGVLVEGGAVEFGKPVRVVGEMPRHPVEQHANAGLVQGIDQLANSAGVPKRLVGANRPVG